MLETPWNKLPAELQKLWLWGTGDEHITFTWRNGAHGHKYGGQFEGIIPQLLSRYRNIEKQHAAAAVGKVHERRAVRRVRRGAAQSASPRGDAHHRPAEIRRPAGALAAGSLQSVGRRRGRVLRRP